MREKANATSVFALRVFCVVTVAACSVLIARDLPTNAIEAPIEPALTSVATITWRHGNVLGTSEHLKTLEASVVELRFPGTGGFALLAPRSEARFTSGAITLLGGGVSVRRPEETLRSLPRTAPAVHAGDFTVQPDREGEVQVIGPQHGKFKVKVLTGSATLVSRAGTVTVRRNEEATFREKAGEPPRIGRLSFTLLAPRDGEPLPADESRVTFSWNIDTATSEGRALELVVADSPSFKNVLGSYVVAASEPPLPYVELKAQIPPARHAWYWKLRCRGDDEWSYPERFWILPRSGPELRYPLAGATTQAGTPLELVWDTVDNAQGYEVEVAGEKSRTPLPFLAVSGLQAGTARWRVRAILSDGEATPWSLSREIAVQ